MKIPYSIGYVLIILLVLSCVEQKPEPSIPAIVKMPEVVESKSTPIDTSINQEPEENISSEANSDKPAPSSQESVFKFKYNINQPDATGKLPYELIEISALSYHAQDNTLLAVNDEFGNIYTIDPKDFSIKEKTRFGSDGDYEGIEIVGNTVYISKSNGNIYPFDLLTGKKGATFKTALSASNNIEGLGYNAPKNELILACKGKPEISKHSKLKDSKAFYAFDLDKKTLE